MNKKDKIINKLMDKGYVEEQIGKYRSDFPQIHTVEVKDVDPVFITHPLLKRVTAIDSDGNVIGGLFVKIYSPSRRIVDFSRQNLERGKLLGYNAEHQKFWSKSEHLEPYQILPTPLFYDSFKEGNRQVLVIEYWPAPSHDLDVITLKHQINQTERSIDDEFVEKKSKEKLKKDKNILLKSLEGITTSTLTTINRISIYGDQFVRQSGLYVFEPEDPRKYYSSKLEGYVEKIKLRNLVKEGLPIEKVRDYLERKKEEPFLEAPFDADIRRAKQEARDSSWLIIEELSMEEDWGYTQGDESLHNLKYHTFKGKSGRGVLRSGVFDWGHAMRRNPILGKAKLLSNPLLDLEYEEAKRSFLESLVSAENLKFNIGERKDGVKSIDDISEDYIMCCMRKFDLFTLYEQICDIGRKSQDEIANKERHDMITSLTVEYRNPHIRFPGNGGPIHISYSPYRTEENILKSIKRLEERIAIMLGKKTDYRLTGEDVDYVGRIGEFVEDNISKEVRENSKREEAETI